MPLFDYPDLYSFGAAKAEELKRYLARLMVEGKNDPLGAAASYMRGAGREGADRLASMAPWPLGNVAQGAAEVAKADYMAKDDSAAEALGEFMGTPVPTGAKVPTTLGAIRKGGDPELFATHSVDTQNLLRRVLPKGELYSPSIAISRGSPHLFGSSKDSAFLFPQLDVLDPARTPGQLFNRDAYTARAGTMQGSLSSAYDYPLKDRAAARLQEKFSTEDIRLTEGANPGWRKTLAIKESPNFKSFADYERSPHGAGALFDGPQPDDAYDIHNAEIDEYLQNLREAWVRELLKTGTYKSRVAALEATDEKLRPMMAQAAPNRPRDLLFEVPKEARPDTQSLVQALRKMPSEYGELKVHSNVPLNAEKFAGAILHERNPNAPALARMFSERGIPTIVDRHFLGGEDLYDQYKLLTEPTNLRLYTLAQRLGIKDPDTSGTAPLKELLDEVLRRQGVL